MMKENTKKYVGFIVLILVIVLGGFLLSSKDANAPADNTPEMPDLTNTETPATPEKPIGGATSALTAEQQTLLAQLKKTVADRDFEAFALALEQVYKKEWGGIDEFKKTESEFYMYAVNEYWVKGDLENSLRVSTIVYNKVSEGWRFRYLRIITLEKYGRNAFKAGDLAKAEDYANQILQMMFRPEGANLIADVYISRVNTNIKDGNTELAKQNLGFIWDYEVSDDRRATLEDLKNQLGI